MAIQALGGDIERAGLVIDFDDVGSANSVAQTFERVRQSLIRRFGAPSSVFNRGEIRPALAEDVNNDQFIRLGGWRTPDRVIRFSIPRRLDRIVRMEVQIARSFPDPTQTRWSFDDLRQQKEGRRSALSGKGGLTLFSTLRRRAPRPGAGRAFAVSGAAG